MNFKEFLVSKGYEITEETSAEKMAEYYSEFNDVKRKELEDAITAKNEELKETIKSELKDNQVDQLKALNDALKAQGLAIKKITERDNDDISLTNANTLDKSLEDNKEALKAMTEGGGKVTLKVAGDMTIIGNISGGNVPVEQREAGVNNVARRRTFIQELVNSGTAVSNVISWVEQQNVDGTVGGTVEGTLKNQIDFDLVVVSENVKKRTAFIKVSTEMLGDIDFMRTEINNELTQRLALDIDDQVLNGNNVGQNLNGIITQSTAYAAGAFALTVVDPNLVDVLTTAANQIDIANHFATSHVVHPTDLTALRLVKAGAADGQYVNRLQDIAGNLTLDGIRVVANTGIAQDEFLTMDGSKDTVFSKGEMTIQVGLDSDDFTKNFRTVLIEWRGLNRIKGNDKTAFVTGTVSTAITALTKP
jgi:HK97 family phage major capsid protein